MPAVVRGKPARQPLALPPRIAIALQPELERATIPSRQTLTTGAVPFAGELREEQTSRPVTLPAGGTVALVTLRRAWLYVGWALSPGDAVGAGLTAQLRILTRGVNGLTAPTAIVAGAPFALTNVTVGAACELVVHNGTLAAVHKLTASIWGMGER